MSHIDKDLNHQVLSSEYILFLLNIKKVSSWLECLANKILSTYDISLGQYLILNILYTHKHLPINIKNISTQMPDQYSNVSRLIDELEKKQLVTRVPSVEDKRRVSVSLTSNGQEIICKCIEHFEKKMKDEMQKFDLEKITETNNFLNQLHFK